MVYTDLEVWVESRKLVSMVYAATVDFPKEEIFGLTNQMRRSAVSVPSNIAEGSGRRTTNNTLQFLYISRGSLFELETQLYLANDLNYLNEISSEQLLTQLTSCKKLLNGFINYYKTLKN